MLAGFRRLDRPFCVERVGRRDIDRLDLGVGEQRVIALEDTCLGEIGGKARAIRVAGRDSNQRTGSGVGKPAGELVPVEGEVYETRINAASAKALGLTVPEDILKGAGKVVE